MLLDLFRQPGVLAKTPGKQKKDEFLLSLDLLLSLIMLFAFLKLQAL